MKNPKRSSKSTLPIKSVGKQKNNRSNTTPNTKKNRSAPPYDKTKDEEKKRTYNTTGAGKQHGRKYSTTNREEYTDRKSTPTKRTTTSRNYSKTRFNEESEKAGNSNRSGIKRTKSNQTSDRFKKELPNENRHRKPISKRTESHHKSETKTKYRNKKSIESSVKEEINQKIRLNRYISNAGICSRREADKLIAAGLVSVNGKTITEMGYQVIPGDQVKYNGERLSTDKKIYLIMNKPKDTICSLDDPDGRKIVTDLINDSSLPRVYPVGRLDRNTTGVLMLTNDGEMAQRLMHPKYLIQKIYKATLNKSIRGEDFWQLTNGIALEDGDIKADSVAMPDKTDKKTVALEIHSGRNRIVHRMFEHMGYKVDKLDRVWFAGFDKRGLKRGEWRLLSDKELSQLKKLVKLK